MTTNWEQESIGRKWIRLVLRMITVAILSSFDRGILADALAGFLPGSYLSQRLK